MIDQLDEQYIIYAIRISHIGFDVAYEKLLSLFTRPLKKMQFLAKTAFLVLLLVMTQVQALICYETVVLDAETKNVTVVEKEITSGYCEIVSCKLADPDMGEPCYQRFGDTNRTRLYFRYGQHRQGYGSDCKALEEYYAPHVCCNTDRCNTVEALDTRNVQDSVLTGLVLSGIFTPLVAIAAAVHFLPMSTSPILKVIQGMKVFNLSISIVVLILLCVSRLPFGSGFEFTLVFIACILSIFFHSIDFAMKKCVQTKVQITCETVILVLYTIGISILIDKMVPWASSSSSLDAKCRLSPTSVNISFGMPNRNICGFINALIGFGELFL